MSQLVAPASSANLPSGHMTHGTSPEEGLIVPFRQDRHLSGLPSTYSMPGGHDPPRQSSPVKCGEQKQVPLPAWKASVELEAPDVSRARRSSTQMPRREQVPLGVPTPGQARQSLAVADELGSVTKLASQREQSFRVVPDMQLHVPSTGWQRPCRLHGGFIVQL